MAPLACGGCAQLIKVEQLRVHMTETHEMFSDPEVLVHVSFMNVEEKTILGQLVQQRMESFKKHGELDTNGNIFAKLYENSETDEVPDLDEDVSDDEELDGDEELEAMQDLLLADLNADPGVTDEATEVGEETHTEEGGAEDNDEDSSPQKGTMARLQAALGLTTPPLPMVTVKVEVQTDLLENPKVEKEVETEAETEVEETEEDAEPEEEEEAPVDLYAIPGFCRLCYTSLEDSTMEEHNKEEHREDREAFSLEPTEANLRHLCTMCPLKYLTGNLLNNHKRKKHLVAVKESKSTCQVCQRVVSSQNFKKHMKVHTKDKKPIVEKKTSCQVCQKVVLTQNLKLHMATHGEKR